MKSEELERKSLEAIPYDLVLMFNVIEKNDSFGGRRSDHLPEVAVTVVDGHLSHNIGVPSFVALIKQIYQCCHCCQRFPSDECNDHYIC